MRKNHFFTSLLFLCSIKFVAQTTDVVTEINEPEDMLLDGNDLYIAQGNKISKIDITSSIPTITDVVSGLDKPNILALRRKNLYIAEGNKISKFNLDTLSTNHNKTSSNIRLYIQLFARLLFLK